VQQHGKRTGLLLGGERCAAQSFSHYAARTVGFDQIPAADERAKSALQPMQLEW
jgi:hypothetical protein